MKGKISREELEERGWRFVHCGYSSDVTVWGKGDKRISWNQKTKEVLSEYRVDLAHFKR